MLKSKTAVIHDRAEKIFAHQPRDFDEDLIFR